MRQALKFKDLLKVFPYSLIFEFIFDMLLTVLTVDTAVWPWPQEISPGLYRTSGFII
ncbi:MAG: hypothetical protein HY067_02820 [Betaproteobacteria bacterium]|nr:hypothetical protein [Betaproteobacteria bacterium]